MRNSRCLFFAAVFLAGTLTASAGTLIDVAFTGDPVTSKTGFAATGVAANDFWNTCNPDSGSLPNVEFVDGTASGAGLTLANVAGANVNGASDPMYGVYLFNGGGNISVTVTNLMAGAYNFYLYGHGNADNQFSIFQLMAGLQSYGSNATINGSGWLSSVWQEGVQYVEFTNVIVSDAQTVTITVAPGAGGYAVLSGLQIAAFGSASSSNAFIVTQPADQTVVQGQPTTFSVVAGGTPPLTYQWLFNYTDISSATNSSYSVPSAQPADAGYYSVIVSNANGSVTSALAVLKVVAPPAGLIDVAFTDVSATSKAGFAATGVTTNDFWNTYDMNAVPLTFLRYTDGTISGAGLTLANIVGVYPNGATDPMYGIYLFNDGGQMILTVNNLVAGLYNFYLYGHGDIDIQSGNFQLTAGSQNYGMKSTDSNNSVWVSSAWQQGVQYVEFTNVNVGVGQTVTVTVDSGNSGYAVISGLQMAFAGPATQRLFIVTQPTNQVVSPGSTATFSILAGGTAPLAYQWLYNNTNISEATNSSYIVTNVQPADAGVYSVLVTNAYGAITSPGAALMLNTTVATTIDVAFTPNPVTTKTGFAATGVTSNDFWNTYVMNSEALPNLKYVDGTVSGAGLGVFNDGRAYGDAASDPMYDVYLYRYAGEGNIIVTVTNLAAGTYSIYLYGHGDGNSQYSVFQLTAAWLDYGSETTTNGAGWDSSIWQEGVQYVQFNNVVVSAGDTITITVEAGTGGYAVISGLQMVPAGPTPATPFIFIQPTNTSVTQGSAANLSVLANGVPPPAYQWLFNNAAISGATNSCLSVTNAQPAIAGNYTVVLSNTYGSVTSAVAALNVILGQVTSVIDVAFTPNSVTDKTGFAATGVASNDFWNTYVMGSGAQPNLKFMDGTASGAGLTLVNANQAYGTSVPDAMYAVYLYDDDGSDIIVTVTNLAAGAYDFYLYGHGNMDSENSVFQLWSDGLNYGSEATINGPGWESMLWQEGVQYVEFTDVNVVAGHPVTIEAEPGSLGLFAEISGLQITPSGVTPTRAYVAQQPADQTVVQGSTASFSVGAEGTAPLAFQWLFNNEAIPTATNSSYILANAQPADAGHYSVLVSNGDGSATSVAAVLNVVLPPANLIDVAFTQDPVTSKTGLAATGVSSDDYWNTRSTDSALPNLKYADGANSGAGLMLSGVFGGYGDGVSDPMYARYLYKENGNLTVAISFLQAGVYDFYLYGHGNYPNQYCIFQLTVGSQDYGSAATTNGPGWDSPLWQEGVQYVEFTNVMVPAGQPVSITVQPGTSGYAVLSGLQVACVGPAPYITIQPADQAVHHGSKATFTVTAGGTAPLTYQWLFNSAIISGATNIRFSVTNAQPTNAGNYSAIVANTYGSVTSQVAQLILLTNPATIMSVAFTGSSVTAKKGLAATGMTACDFWNTCTLYAGASPNPKLVDGTISDAAVMLSNANGEYGDSVSDPMYARYLYKQGGNITVTVTNLTAGAYNFYLYGHGNQNNQNTVFQLKAGPQYYGSGATTNGSGWISSIWQAGVQYVGFTNVSVSAGQPIAVTVQPGAGGYAVLSGLQIEAVAPLVINVVSNQFVNAHQEVVITNFASSSRGAVSFTLALGAPAGAMMRPNGIFTWTPACEQGSTTNLITVWARDSSSPPLSNSMTFSVIVGECVEISIGSSVAQTGQSTCVPVSLVATVGLTNLSFTLAYPSGFLTNWSVAPSNSAVASATANTVDPSHTQFNIGVQSGQVLQGSTVIGSICLDTLPGNSAFVPLAIGNMGATASDNSPVTNLIGQPGRVVVIGSQPLLEASIGTNSSRALTLYGNSGASYRLLTTTNLNGGGSWSTAGSATLTNMLQVFNFGGATNQMQFYRAVQP